MKVKIAQHVENSGGSDQRFDRSVLVLCQPGPDLADDVLPHQGQFVTADGFMLVKSVMQDRNAQRQAHGGYDPVLIQENQLDTPASDIQHEMSSRMLVEERPDTCGDQSRFFLSINDADRMPQDSFQLMGQGCRIVSSAKGRRPQYGNIGNSMPVQGGTKSVGGLEGIPDGSVRDVFDACPGQLDEVAIPVQDIKGCPAARSGDQQMEGVRAEVGNGKYGMDYCEDEVIFGKGTPILRRNWTPISFNRTAVARISYS